MLTNYVAVTRTKLIFLKTKVAGSSRHTGKAITYRLKAVIKEIGGKEAVITVTTDNASNIKKAWPLVEQRYPSILTLGYASHIVNLAVEDIFRVSTIGGALQSAITVIKYFRNSTILTGLLNEVTKATGKQRPALQLPGNTRWQGKLLTIKSLIANQSFIKAALDNRLKCLGASPTLAAFSRYEEIQAI